MALRGSGVVIMWHDITPEGDAAYNQWHTQEHMPERIALPGFLRARRGVNKALERQHYFTLYECETLAATASPEYRNSLNFPTEWTQRIAPQFRNFKRMTCETVVSQSRGVGGSLITFRANPVDGIDAADLVARLSSQRAELLTFPSVTGVHVAVARDEFSSGETTEVRIRPVMSEPDFSIVVVVEGIGLAESCADQGDLQALLEEFGLCDIIAQSYDMAYMLDEATA